MKNEIKHTPGPWESEHMHTAICKGDMTLARVYYGEGRTYEESCANARLIAAAPEMLEKLVDVMKNLHVDMHETEIQAMRKSILVFLSDIGFMQ